MPVPEPGEDVEGRGGRRRRRLWSMDDKRRIVAETFEPGASVSMVARRYDLNANMLFTWRREATALVSPVKAGFVPATITSDPVPPASQEATGRMEITLAGGARVIVGADVDAAALARVMKVLSRR